jgi:hypothetical protein
MASAASPHCGRRPGGRGQVRSGTTPGDFFGLIDAANIARADPLIESGEAKGKVVLAGFAD